MLEEGEEVTPGGVVIRKKELLARLLVERALLGNQFAIEAVLDRVEGKAVRGQAAAQVDNSIEEQIGRAEVAALNALSDKEG